MCGRYTVGRPGQVISRILHRKISGEMTLPTYNASPGQLLPVILDAAPQRIVPARWGMRGSGGRLGNRLVINARAESVAQRPMFRDAFRERRCLIAADGFYEWQKSEGGKQPFRITLRTGALFTFAGVWSESPEGPCYVIITTRPNSVTRAIHDRMPVILGDHEAGLWLERELDADAALDLLDPYPESEMTAYPVSRAVNNWRNDSPGLIEALGAGRQAR